MKARTRRPARHPRRDVPTSAQRLVWTTEPAPPRKDGVPGLERAVLKPYGTCRVCGCVDARACPGGCSWTDESHTLCSKCSPPERKAA